MHHSRPSPSKHPADSKEALSELLKRQPLKFIYSWRGRTTAYFPFHSHTVVELVYHPRGTGITTMDNGQCLPFDVHGVVLYPAFLGHDQRMTALGDDVCIQAAASDEINALLTEAIYIPPTTETRKADRFVRTEFLHLSQLRSDESRSAELDLRVTALLLRLLQIKHEVARELPCTPTEQYLVRARSFIRTNYARITCTREIASHIGISEDYLRHLFQAQAGTSLNRLLSQTRIERAKELLMHSRLPLKNIASLTGFKTERYLSTCFKEAVGKGPTAFRRETMDARR